MSAKVHTREVGPLSMRADVVPGSLNEEARTVDVVWTTGARVKRSSWFDGPWYEELSTNPNHVRMERLLSGRAPVLLQHNAYDPDAHQGVVTTARLSEGKGTATLRFLTGDADADKTWNKIRQGVLTSVSVGYSVHKSEKIEGGDETIPVYRATDWEPYEISPVAMGADPDAHMRSANLRTNMCEFVTRGQEPQKESRTMDEDMKVAAAEAARKAEVQVAAEAAASAERERANTITLLVRKAAIDATTADTLIAEGKTVDEARAFVLGKLMERSESTPISSHVRIEGGLTEKEKRVRGATAWMVERVGATELIERAAKDPKHGRRFKDMEVDGGEFRGMTLLDIARDCLERGGVNTRGMDRMELVGRAFTQRSSGYQTTSDFAVLFENVMHKLVLGAYATTQDTWSRFCKTDTVSDFRASNRFRTGSFSSLDNLNEAGEFKNKAIPDGEKTSITTATKGNIIALSRKAIINDDMGALADMATKLGRSARLSIEVDVYALLALNSGLGPTQTDTNPFFHSARSNVNGTGSTLAVAGIDADRVVMAQQRDITSNEYLDLRPAVLLVPVGLGGEARVVNDSQYEPADNKFMKPNKVRGLFRDVVDTPRLSGTRRYLFADPSIAPAIVVAFLEGQGEAPMLESQDGWRVDGTEWKVRLDVKAQMFDPRGAVTNAGT